jgi:uncharacterized protein YndB with AHSA1/START domain
MMLTKETRIVKDPAGNKLTITRDFDAPVEKIWKAWTDRDLLDAWWAPKPWKAETRSMNFANGGQWHYAMVGPKGERRWCLVHFQAIQPGKSFKADSTFCDEQKKVDPSMPVMHWHTAFTSEGAATSIHVEISFDNLSDLDKIIEMGFKEGFTKGLDNLDVLLAG